jgi:DnaJ like chaperone protein
MQWTGKLIGAALGAMFGPVGIAVGATLGHQYDTNSERRGALPPGEQFFQSAFRLIGHVAKADGRVTEREIDAARSVMQGLRLNPAQVQLAIAHFSAGKQPQFNLAAEMTALRVSCHSHPQILRVFVEILLRFALTSGDMTGTARTRVTQAAGLLGIAPPLLARIEAAMRGGGSGGGDARGGDGRGADAFGARAAAQHANRVAAAYRTLEVETGVTNEALTKAYRRLMSRHHPDKLKANGLPDSMLEHAKQRTQVIREAYDLLREQRGMA